MTLDNYEKAWLVAGLVVIICLPIGLIKMEPIYFMASCFTIVVVNWIVFGLMVRRNKNK